MSTPGRAGVVFDLDGTLVDSNYLHTLAWVRALRGCGEWVASNAVHRLVGMGGDQLVPELLGRDLPEASEQRKARYGELIDEVQPFPGAAGLLADVASLGLAVVLATSAPADELDRLLPLVGGRGRFDALTSSADVSASKPDPEIFRTAVERGGLDPARALTVGDSVWDVQASRAAGLACVAVETGGFSRHELAEAGALAVYRDAGELRAQLRTSPVGALVAQL